MDIAEIDAFLAIAELGGFARAAQRLYRTQPAISRLQILEHELGAPLFERLRGRARLTEAGRTFLPHAAAALASLRDGRDAVRTRPASVGKAEMLAGERWGGFPPTPGEPGSGQILARQLVRAGLADPDVILIDSLTAQKRLAQAGFGLALVPESSVRDELRHGTLVSLDIPAMRTTFSDHCDSPPHRLSQFRARSLLSLLTRTAGQPA